jgi:hypothetical protein
MGTHAASVSVVIASAHEKTRFANFMIAPPSTCEDLPKNVPGPALDKSTWFSLYAEARSSEAKDDSVQLADGERQRADTLARCSFSTEWPEHDSLRTIRRSLHKQTKALTENYKQRGIKGGQTGLCSNLVVV